MKNFVWEPSARTDLRRIEQALAILHALTCFARGGNGDVKTLTDDAQGRLRLRLVLSFITYCFYLLSLVYPQALSSSI